MFLKLLPELKKKNKYIYIYIYIYIYVFHAQVIQNCTTLSCVDIYDKDGKQQDLKQRKRKPGKRCVVMFCNKTNADGVSLHQFPQTLDAGQYIWLLPATIHCNILQIFILTTSTSWQKMFSSTLYIDLQFPYWHLEIKKISKVAIFFYDVE